jgi:hypothetical protein
MEDAKKEVVGGNGVGAAAVVDVEAEKEKETDALVNSTKVQRVVIFTEKKNALKSLLIFEKKCCAGFGISWAFATANKLPKTKCRRYFFFPDICFDISPRHAKDFKRQSG